MFCKKGVLKNFVKFTGNFLYQSLFFNKVPGCSFSLDQVFPVNFAKFVGTPFFYRTPPASQYPFLQSTFNGCFYSFTKFH